MGTALFGQRLRLLCVIGTSAVIAALGFAKLVGWDVGEIPEAMRDPLHMAASRIGVLLVAASLTYWAVQSLQVSVDRLGRSLASETRTRSLAQIQQQIISAANQAQSSHDAVSATLERICALGNWEMGLTYWRDAPSGDRLPSHRNLGLAPPGPPRAAHCGERVRELSAHRPARRGDSRGLDDHRLRAIDDFGTGYASINQLRTLPFDSLKIDRSYVTGIASNESARALTEAIIVLARRVLLHTVAEGVETEGEARILRELGCDSLQGYAIGRPVPPSGIEPMLEPEKAE